MTTPPEVPAALPPVSGADLLDEVREFIGRFVAFPSPAALNAATLWAAHAHLVHEGENSPRLALLSPEPGSGKTRTLEVLELLTPAPMSVLSASPAAVFRSIEADRPTLLMDEVDAIFNRRGSDDGAEDLRALLNAGHRKGATIPRCVGPRHDVARFGVYCAVAMAGLGDLPDTLMSRSVIVRMRRRAPGEHVEPFRRRLHAPAGHELADRLADWALSVAESVGDAWPAMPDGITDRPADVWEPLLAVADAAAGHWPTTARAACVELAKVAESREASLGVRLLADLRNIFGENDALHTETILDSLHKLDEAPWGDLHGKPLDARGLARRLRQYEIGSTTVKIAGKALKGYQREHLWDTWTRYLALTPSPEGVTSVTPVTDPDSERENADRQVTLTTAGNAPSVTPKSERYLPDPESERENAPANGGNAGNASPGRRATGTGYLPRSGDSATSATSATDAESEHDSAQPEVAPKVAGRVNAATVRDPTAAESERESKMGRAGRAGRALSETGADGTDCGHPVSARHTDNGKCGTCIADRVNAERRACTEDSTGSGDAPPEDVPALPHKCSRCLTPIRHRGGMCVPCFGEVSLKAKEEIS